MTRGGVERQIPSSALIISVSKSSLSAFPCHETSRLTIFNFVHSDPRHKAHYQHETIIQFHLFIILLFLYPTPPLPPLYTPCGLN